MSTVLWGIHENRTDRKNLDDRFFSHWVHVVLLCRRALDSPAGSFAGLDWHP